MKTIKSFLIGIFTLVLFFGSLIYSVVLLSDSTTLYYKANQTDPTTFTTTFVVVSVILFAVGLHLLMYSLASFKLFIQYHNTYLDHKRDRQIKEQFTNETYKQLYKDLADAPNMEIKEAIINTFYKQDKGGDILKDFGAIIEKLFRM